MVKKKYIVQWSIVCEADNHKEAGVIAYGEMLKLVKDPTYGQGILRVSDYVNPGYSSYVIIAEAMGVYKDNK
jgi:hypothetical protein